MGDLGLIMSFRARGLLSRAREVRLNGLPKNMASLIVVGSFALGVFFLSRGLTTYLVREVQVGLVAYHRLLSSALYMLFVTVNLGNMLVCYATLYRSPEVGFLMGLPVRHESIFLVKFLDNFFFSSSTLALLGLAVLMGYGSSFGLPWYFYPVTIGAVLLPFLLIAALVAVILLMLVIRVATRVGIRRLLACLVLLYVLAIYLYFARTDPFQFVQQVMRRGPGAPDSFGALDPPFVRFLPNQWVAEFLYWWVDGTPARGLPYLIMLFSTLAGLFSVARFTSRQLYYQSWLDVSDARAMLGKRARRLRIRMMEFGARTRLSLQSSVLLRREFWLFVRDPGQWLHLFLMLVLMVIFLVSLGSTDVRLVQPFLQGVLFVSVLGFNGFMTASVALRFVFPSVSMEGAAFWSVRTAPVSLRRLYGFKFILAAGVVLTVAEFLGVTAAALLQHDLRLSLFISVVIALMALAMTALNLGAGAYFATFKERNAIRVASSQGASLTLLLSVTYLAIVVTLLLLPLSRYFQARVTAPAAALAVLYPPLAAIAVLSVLLMLGSTLVGLRAVQRDQTQS